MLVCCCDTWLASQAVLRLFEALGIGMTALGSISRFEYALFYIVLMLVSDACCAQEGCG